MVSRSADVLGSRGGWHRTLFCVYSKQKGLSDLVSCPLLGRYSNLLRTIYVIYVSG